jgi:hypothetical protein
MVPLPSVWGVHLACPSGVMADHFLEAARRELAHRGLLAQPLVALDGPAVETHII